MNTNTMELNLNEMETANGGINWDRVVGISWGTGTIAAAFASVAVVAISGPVGWGVAAAAIGGAAIAGAVTGGGITAAVTAND